MSDHSAPTPYEAYMDLEVDLDWLRAEIRTLREFIADVRLGIRDLDEYEAICNPGYV